MVIIMPKRQIKTHYDDVDRVYKDFTDDVLTEQGHARSCDINNIIRTYNITGSYGTPLGKPRQPMFMDDTVYPVDLIDYHDRISEVQNQFDALPSSLREECNNDWRQFVLNTNNPEIMQDWSDRFGWTFGNVDNKKEVKEIEKAEEPNKKTKKKNTKTAFVPEEITEIED